MWIAIAIAVWFLMGCIALVQSRESHGASVFLWGWLTVSQQVIAWGKKRIGGGRS